MSHKYVDVLGGKEIDDNGQMKDLLGGNGAHLAERAGLGICGRHGGNPSSVGCCYQLGLNPVSCSLCYLPIAR